VSSQVAPFRSTRARGEITTGLPSWFCRKSRMASTLRLRWTPSPRRFFGSGEPSRPARTSPWGRQRLPGRLPPLTPGPEIPAARCRRRGRALRQWTPWRKHLVMTGPARRRFSSSKRRSRSKTAHRYCRTGLAHCRLGDSGVPSLIFILRYLLARDGWSTMTPSKMAALDWTWKLVPTTRRSRWVPRRRFLPVRSSLGPLPPSTMKLPRSRS